MVMRHVKIEQQCHDWGHQSHAGNVGQRHLRSWHRKAAADPAESGAMRMLGSAYADGNGRNINQARYWLQQAMSQGDQDASQILNKLRSSESQK
jgi:TPR repeat protein